MSVLLQGFHPSFDALSAYADLSDVDAARTRVGRHVARCASCAASVAEIRALGDAAREVELPGAPAELWSRIAAARDEAASRPGETPSVAAEPWIVAPSLRPTTHVALARTRTLRRGVIALATAAALLGLLLLPSPFSRRLEASPDRGTWRFSPAAPRPGQTVTVRFEPTAAYHAADRLLLLGSVVLEGAGDDANSSMFDGLVDSLGTLVRRSDGAFVGSIVTPRRFAAIGLHVAPLAGPYHVWGRRYIAPTALLVGGDGGATPSLASLTTAVGRGYGMGSQGLARYSAADTLIKYYPSEPIGYAFDQRVGGKHLFEDMLAYFNRGEHQYTRFDDRYSRLAVVDAGRERAMAVFASRISEPGEMRRWVMRMAREHPDDPRTLSQYGVLLSSMLSRSGTMDSVRSALPLADSLYERNGHRGDLGDLVSVAARLHDKAAEARWSLRSLAAVRDRPSRRQVALAIDADLLGSDSIRRAARPLLREKLTGSCILPPGRYPAWGTTEQWRIACIGGRSGVYASLSSLVLRDGDRRAALAFADSSLAVLAADTRCWFRVPHQRRGEALLALGDTASAVRELAMGTTGFDWRGGAVRDSVGRALRTAIDSAQWVALTSKATADLHACLAENRARSTKEWELDSAAAALSKR